MNNRITIKDLERQVKRINDAAGFPDISPYNNNEYQSRLGGLVLAR